MILIYLEKKKDSVKEMRGSVVTINGVSLVAKAEIKVGKIHNTEWWVNECFECLNIWEQP